MVTALQSVHYAYAPDRHLGPAATSSSLLPQDYPLLGFTLLPNLVGEEVERLPTKGLGNKLMLDMWVSDQSWLFQESFYLN